MSADLQQQEVPEVPAEKVVEQPGAEQADAAQSEESTADAKPPDAEDESAKKTRRHVNAIQNRINDLTREKHDERREKEAIAAELRELKAQLTAEKGKTSEPKLEQFRTYDEFIDAKATWKAEQIVAAKLEEFSQKNLKTFEERSNEERAAQAAQQFDRALTVVEKEGTTKFKDFVDVVSQGPRLGPMVGDLVMRTEKPAEITYYLAKNPEQAIAIASMHPMMMAREIGKLEAQFSSKRVTSAPPPPKTVGSSDKGPQGLSDDLSSEEWYRRRAAQIRQGKG